MHLGEPGLLHRSYHPDSGAVDQDVEPAVWRKKRILLPQLLCRSERPGIRNGLCELLGARLVAVHYQDACSRFGK